MTLQQLESAHPWVSATQPAPMTRRLAALIRHEGSRVRLSHDQVICPRCTARKRANLVTREWIIQHSRDADRRAAKETR